jgi:hypothetical protein
MSDGLFFTLVIGFFFAIWLVGGGPSKPISFAGAYITPITGIDTTQVGYGPKLTASTTLALPGISASIGDKDTSPTSAPAISTYSGQITISRSTAPSQSDPSQKYIHLLLTSNASAPVRVSDWRFVSTADSATVIIQNEDASLAPNTSTVVVTSFPSSTPHDTIQLEDASSKVVSTFTY